MNMQWPPPPPAPAPPPKSQRALWFAALAVAAVVAAGVGGVLLGSGLHTHRDSEPEQVVTAEHGGDTHAQDVALCTRYVIVNASLPDRSSSGLQLLTAAAVLENALGEYPGASPEITSALTAVVQNYYRSAARSGEVRTRGLAEPPSYDLEEAEAIYDRAWTVCGLDQG